MRLVGVVLAAALLITGCSSAQSSTSPSVVRTTPSTSSVAAPPAVPVAVPPTQASTTTQAPPPPNPCVHNTATKLVKVSIRKQHMWLCARTVASYDAPITSGVVGQYTSTPTGTYEIQGINRNSTLTLNTGATYAVKYWIPFDAPLFGFHDSSWQDFPYGSAKYKTQGSHGCVHLPLKAIRHLAQWATIGTKVTIRA